MISSASKPSNPTLTQKGSLGKKVKASFSKEDGHSDLYAWREIFTLWIEAEIFESGAERDRGERTIEEAERRLKAFAGELTRRNLGDRRTLKVCFLHPWMTHYLRLTCYFSLSVVEGFPVCVQHVPPTQSHST